MNVDECFCAAGVNARSHSLSVASCCDYVVYGSECHLVVETFPELTSEHGSVVSVSQQYHSKSVSSVKRLKGKGDYFVSGGVDGVVNVWALGDNGTLSHCITLEGCTDSVAAACGVYRTDEIVVIASWAGTSCGMRAWWIDTGSWNVRGSTELPLQGNSFALTIDCHQQTNGSILLAVGNSLRKIELYSESGPDCTFESVISIIAHSDWIHSVGFNGNSDYLLLASAGQDTFVKLWRIEEDSSEIDEEELSVTRNKFTMKGTDGAVIRMSINVEAVLAGHDDWVYSTEWNTDGTALVTSSSDKTTIIWKEQEGLWSDTVRLGIVGGQAAGFFCAGFSRNGRRIVASSYFGGLHAWVAGEEESSAWQPISMSGGHVGEVRDISWDPSGSYLVSVGKDQTTRVYAPVGCASNKSFSEIARPQVHGHDMQCLAVVSPASFVSGAEEKIFRAFQAPETFASSLCNISILDKKTVFSDLPLAEFGARVPALGLSNKAVDEEDETTVADAHWEEQAFQANPTELKGPPTEDCLQQNTLWPEQHKLYGHGFEVYAIAANPSGTVLATACKASQADHAAIILWDTSDWSRKANILGHQLTVTQLEWSPDGRFLLSVSRDRTAILYKESDGNLSGFNYAKLWSSAKEHSRIIWSCAWAADSTHFATASRDMKVIVWKLTESMALPVAAHKFTLPVTAVAIGSHSLSDVIACGLQDGSVTLLKWDGGSELKPADCLFKPSISVDSAVLRLRFRPSGHGQMLAYAGANGKTRIVEISHQMAPASPSPAKVGQKRRSRSITRSRSPRSSERDPSRERSSSSSSSSRSRERRRYSSSRSPQREESPPPSPERAPKPYKIPKVTDYALASTTVPEPPQPITVERRTRVSIDEIARARFNQFARGTFLPSSDRQKILQSLPLVSSPLAMTPVIDEEIRVLMKGEDRRSSKISLNDFDLRHIQEVQLSVLNIAELLLKLGGNDEGAPLGPKAKGYVLVMEQLVSGLVKDATTWARESSLRGLGINPSSALPSLRTATICDETQECRKSGERRPPLFGSVLRAELSATDSSLRKAVREQQKQVQGKARKPPKPSTNGRGHSSRSQRPAPSAAGRRASSPKPQHRPSKDNLRRTFPAKNRNK